MQPDQGREQGIFAHTLEGMRKLYRTGFSLFIVNQVIPNIEAEGHFPYRALLSCRLQWDS